MEREIPTLEKAVNIARDAGIVLTVLTAAFGSLGLAVSIGFLTAAIHAGSETLRSQRLKSA